MMMEVNVDSAIEIFCTAAEKGFDRRSNTLQKVAASLDIINSELNSTFSGPSSATPTSIEKNEKFQNFTRLIPNVLLNLISDIPNLKDNDALYWYGQVLQLTYQCFRVLRVNKLLLHINFEYFHSLLRQTSNCLCNVHNINNYTVILLLLRIIYACMAGLPIDTIDVYSVTSALVPYFEHEVVTVQVSARNAAQFVIPTLDENSSKFFILSSKNVNNVLMAAGTDMPISSTLKLIISYGYLAENCNIYLKEGVFLYAVSILFWPPKKADKHLAFLTLKLLSSCQETKAPHHDENTSKNEIHETLLSTENKQNSIVHAENNGSIGTNTRNSDENATESTTTCITKTAESDNLIKAPQLFSKLTNLINLFISSCLQVNYDQCRDFFKSFGLLLNEIKEKTFDQCSQDEMRLAKKMVTNDIDCLLKVLPCNDENQFISWVINMIFQCWEQAKHLVKVSGELFHDDSLVSLIDTLLTTIVNTGKKKINQVLSKILSICLDILDDLMYGNIFDGTLPKPAIQKCLLELDFTKYHPSFQFRFKVCLCSVITSTDSIDLSIKKDEMAPLIQHLKSCDSIEEITVILKMLKALTALPLNCRVMKQMKILPILESFVEQFSNSIVESLSADLIYTLMLDSSDNESDTEKDTDPLANFEIFMSACFKGLNLCEIQSEKLKEVLDLSVKDSKIENIPQIAVTHANYLYQVMVLSHDEFNRVFESNKLTDLTYLVSTTKLLGHLSVLYEQNNASAEVVSIIEKQIVHFFKMFLPELACVAFRALKVLSDNNPELWSDLDREIYFTSLMSYLLDLHSAIENWSRMGFSVKTALVNYGAFHLLLNELHTAPTAKIITDEILYLAVTALYNVTLEPQIARRFRITITKKLFDHLVRKNDAGIRLLTIFCQCCMYPILSKHELSQMYLRPLEANMIMKCLTKDDPFFAGFDNLITTIANLSRCPKVREVFIDTGIVTTLKALAFDKASSSAVFKALLNMIPEPETYTQKLPCSNSITLLLMSDPAFLKLIQKLNTDICQALVILLSPPKVISLDDIRLLYAMHRYVECCIFCKEYIAHVADEDKNNFDKKSAKIYEAKSMYHDYERDILLEIEKSSQVPSFEFKEIMQNFSKNRIVPVIKTLSYLRESCDESYSQLRNDGEAISVLDKALLDYVIFNNKNDVSVCLLCHKKASKLIHSHYIPKAILQDSLKAAGLDAGASVYVTAGKWQYQSAKQLTYSMLCKTCDGTILSEEENKFKKNFFSIIYQSADSVFTHHSVTYSQYLYKFAAGLFFRNIALLYSDVRAEISDVSSLQYLMESFRQAVLNLLPNQIWPKIYLLALPLKIPTDVSQIFGWDRFVIFSNSQYNAYKLLTLGEPMVPKSLYCFMVKIGVLLFLVSLDSELDTSLNALCHNYEIKLNSDVEFVFNIPRDEERGQHLPKKLWWSLIGWAKLEINQLLTVGMAMKPPKPLSERGTNIMALEALHAPEDAPIQHITANLLPPGFELNYEKSTILPDQVIVVPKNHQVLLHHSYQATTGSQCYAVLGRCKQNDIDEKKEKRDKKMSAYSAMPLLYVLVYLEDVKKRLSLKTGFFIDDKSFKIINTLPGVPKDSLEVKKLMDEIPDVVCHVLRAKGLRNLKSLIFWQDFIDSIFGLQAHDMKQANFSLDTKCLKERCTYCSTRCDVCLLHCYEHFKEEKTSDLREVFCCSEICSMSLFTSTTSNASFILKTTDELLGILPGYKKLMSGYFTIDDTEYIQAGLKTTVQFIVCQPHSETAAKSNFHIMVWVRNISKPICMEYIVDDAFNAVCPLKEDFFHGMSVFSEGEEKEIMNQVHYMLVRIGLPYHFTVSCLKNNSYSLSSI